MMHCLVMREIASLNVQTDLLISISERHAFAHQTVYLFNAENKQVLIVIQNMLVHFDFIHNIGRHLQTILQLPESRQEYFLNNLQIAEIPGRQVIGYHHYLLGQ